MVPLLNKHWQAAGVLNYYAQVPRQDLRKDPVLQIKDL
jgi:hypothetical protein